MTGNRALITGITGQDGAYLSRLLLSKGYEVYGAMRRSSNMTMGRLQELNIHNDIEFVDLELNEISNIFRVIDRIRPSEIYNLAAQSFVSTSWDQPLYTSDTNAMGVTRLLEAVRVYSPATRFYQASTSEMYGKAQAVPQNEKTPFYPRSPYGIAKLYGHWITVNYRESFGMHATSGILFNHESPLRGIEFVTRKITLSLARIVHKQLDVLELGNLDVKRDWGYADDYVKGMWLMLQQESAGDYVLATGETHSVREFLEAAFSALDIELEWEGDGQDSRAVDKRSGKTLVKVNPKYYRPAEVDFLVGDASKARSALGWSPSVDVFSLAAMMVKADYDRVKRGTIPF